MVDKNLDSPLSTNNSRKEKKMGIREDKSIHSCSPESTSLKLFKFVTLKGNIMSYPLSSPCNQCGKFIKIQKFNSKYKKGYIKHFAIRSHVETHLETTWQCPICAYANCKSNIKKHLKSWHKIPVADYEMKPNNPTPGPNGLANICSSGRISINKD